MTGTDKSQEFKEELARRLIAWEGSSKFASELAEEIFDLFLEFEALSNSETEDRPARGAGGRLPKP